MPVYLSTRRPAYDRLKDKVGIMTKRVWQRCGAAYGQTETSVHTERSSGRPPLTQLAKPLHVVEFVLKRRAFNLLDSLIRFGTTSSHSWSRPVQMPVCRNFGEVTVDTWILRVPIHGHWNIQLLPGNNWSLKEVWRGSAKSSQRTTSCQRKRQAQRGKL